MVQECPRSVPTLGPRGEVQEVTCPTPVWYLPSDPLWGEEQTNSSGSGPVNGFGSLHSLLILPYTIEIGSGGRVRIWCPPRPPAMLKAH